MIDYDNYNLDEEIKKLEIFKVPKYNKYLNTYGYKKIVKQLFDIEDIDSIDAYLFHGIILTDHELWKRTENYKMPIICTRNDQLEYYLKNGRNKDNTFAVGALFPQYKNLNNIKHVENPKGTIVYPAHSGASLFYNISWENYIKKLKELPEEFHPIDICMYYTDVLDGHHKIFTDNGFKVYMAGHRLDPDFVDNFYEILRHYKYATANTSVASNLLYSIEFGIPTFVYGEENENFIPIPKDSNSKYAKELHPQGYEEYYKFHDTELKKVIPEYPHQDIQITEEQKEKVQHILGLDFEYDKKKVKKSLLRYASKKKIKQKIKDYFKPIINITKCPKNKKQIILFSFIKISYKQK